MPGETMEHESISCFQPSDNVQIVDENSIVVGYSVKPLPIIAFTDGEGSEVGSFDVEDGELVFKGSLSKSVRPFVSMLKEIWKTTER